MKKVFLVFMSLMFIICLVGCGENELDCSRKNAKQEISKYVQLLNENDYTKDGWNNIIGIVNESNVLIDKEEELKDIENYKNNALAAINLVIPTTLTKKWIDKHFDLNDEKKIWNGNIEEMFTDDLIIITLMKTNTFPILDLNCFGLENATGLEYVGGETPPEYFYKPEYKDLLEKYRQVVFIHLEPLGKEKVIESIRKLEKLEFIKSVNPNYIQSGA